jgi:hypothetical protein
MAAFKLFFAKIFWMARSSIDIDLSMSDPALWNKSCFYKKAV